MVGKSPKPKLSPKTYAETAQRCRTAALCFEPGGECHTKLSEAAEVFQGLHDDAVRWQARMRELERMDQEVRLARRSGARGRRRQGCRE